MVELGVNIDHVATVRQARRGTEPDPVAAALAAERGGAKWITAHLREDRRHIQDEDIFLIHDEISIPFNLEMACTDEMIDIALKLMPAQVTFVPEKRAELTTEGGLNVKKNLKKLKEATTELKSQGIGVSFFIDPDEEQIKAAQKAGAQFAELHTGDYANANSLKNQERELVRLVAAGQTLHELGLRVNAGHGLNYLNAQEILKIPYLEQVHLGHGIVARALFDGMENAVREMVELLS